MNLKPWVYNLLLIKIQEVCNYSVKPPHRNMWELKPEYRHYKAPEDEGEKKKADTDSDSD